MTFHTSRFFWLTLALSFGLVACQSTPLPQKEVAPPVKVTESQKQTVPTPDGVKITPYDHPEIIREKAPNVISTPKTPIQEFDDGRDTPAIQHLLQATRSAFQKGQWAEAEKYAMHVQRLAPQSSESYYWLAEVALKQNKASNAESLARRGLSYAQNTTAKKQLWQVLLKSGQLQKKSILIQEAQSQLKAL